MDPEPAPVPRPTLRLTRVEKRYPCFTFGMAALANEIVVLDRGRIVRRAATRELLAEGPLEQVFLDATAGSTVRRVA